MTEQLSHEKLDVYQCAIELLAQASQIIDRLPRGYATLADQLRRASISIPLNIAEGAGKCSPPDKKRFYAIARGSTLECGAIVDCCFTLGLISSQTLQVTKALIVRAAAMLSKLAA
jgi:four helix bundle protein